MFRNWNERSLKQSVIFLLLDSSLGGMTFSASVLLVLPFSVLVEFLSLGFGLGFGLANLALLSR